jgi:hypothetical protein
LFQDLCIFSREQFYLLHMCTNSCFLNVAITTSLYMNVASMMLLISLELGNYVMMQADRNNEFVGEWRVSLLKSLLHCAAVEGLFFHHFHHIFFPCSQIIFIYFLLNFQVSIVSCILFLAETR